jgi:hypothetical protein
MDDDKVPEEGIKIILSDAGKDKIVFTRPQPFLKVVPRKVFFSCRPPSEVKAIKAPKE